MMSDFPDAALERALWYLLGELPASGLQAQEDTSATDVEALSEKLNQDVGRLETVISALSQYTARRKARLLRRQNELTPFYSLPMHLVGEVLEEVLLPTRWQTSHYLRALYTLARVSYGWWRALQCHKTLWTEISIGRARLAPVFVRRAGGLPLRVTMPEPAPNSWRKGKSPGRDICVKEAKSIALSHRNRWQEITIRSKDVEEIQNWLGEPLPWLREATIHHVAGGCLLESFPGGHRLETLVFRSILTTDASAYQHLRKLHISGVLPINVDAFVDVIQSCHTLQSLSLDFMSSNDWSNGNAANVGRKVVLPVLTECFISNYHGDFESFFRLIGMISAPNADRLCLDFATSEELAENDAVTEFVTVWAAVLNDPQSLWREYTKRARPDVVGVTFHETRDFSIHAGSADVELRFFDGFDWVLPMLDVITGFDGSPINLTITSGDDEEIEAAERELMHRLENISELTLEMAPTAIRHALETLLRSLDNEEDVMYPALSTLRLKFLYMHPSTCDRERAERDAKAEVGINALLEKLLEKTDGLMSREGKARLTVLRGDGATFRSGEGFVLQGRAVD